MNTFQNTQSIISATAETVGRNSRSCRTRVGDVGVVVLCAHDSLDAVDDEVVGLEAVAHSVCVHGL
jgi:hypothetical protein